MTSTASAYPLAAQAPRLFRSVERLRGALLWLTGFAGVFVFVEPSPYEITSLLTIFVFVCTGLTLRPALMPLIVLLLLYNIGFSLAVVQVTDQSKPVIWVAISWFLSATAIFFAAMLCSNTQERLSFLVLPALLALQRVLHSRSADALRASLLFGMMAVAVLLTFSRAAWGQFALTAVLVMFFTFVTSRSPNERMRIVLIAIAGLVVMALVLAALLSTERVAELFKER